MYEGLRELCVSIWRHLRRHLFVVSSYLMGVCKEYGTGFFFFEGTWCLDERQQTHVKAWEIFVRC